MQSKYIYYKSELSQTLVVWETINFWGSPTIATWKSSPSQGHWLMFPQAVHLFLGLRELLLVISPWLWVGKLHPWDIVYFMFFFNRSFLATGKGQSHLQSRGFQPKTWTTPLVVRPGCSLWSLHYSLRERWVRLGASWLSIVLQAWLPHALLILNWSAVQKRNL